MTLHQPTHPPFTTEALIKWLRQQPPDAEYIWSDPAFCMMANYLADHGASWGAVAYSEMPGYREIAETKPHSYGAALARAEKLLALPTPPAQIPVPPQPLALPTPPQNTRELVPVSAG